MTMQPEGVYQAVLLQVQTTEPKEEGKHAQLVCEFDLLDEKDDQTGLRRSVYLSLSPKAMEAFVEDELEKHGFNWDFESPRLADAYYESPGVALYCKHEEYNGQLKERWNFSSGNLGKPAEAKTLASLSSRYKHKTQKVVAPGTKPTAASAPKRSAPRSAPPAKVESKFKNIDDCYTAYGDYFDSLDATALNKKWDADCEAVTKETGVAYDDFGPAEFNRVMELAEIPF